jgi:hypothetical protein
MACPQTQPSATTRSTGGGNHDEDPFGRAPAMLDPGDHSQRVDVRGVLVLAMVLPSSCATTTEQCYLC